MTLSHRILPTLSLALILIQTLALPAPAATARPPSLIFDVREHGALGDGRGLDTAALNRAIDACAAHGGGQVRFPPGRYLTGTVHLKSDVTLFLEAGAVIVGSPDPEHYEHFTPPEGTPLARNVRWHRALLLGVGVENVAITGPGMIDGNKVFDPRGEERMRGPHTILFGNSSQIAIRDISIRDSANYAVMLEFTSHVEVRGIKITGGWDAIHFRGWKDKPCRDIAITDSEFYTGDDCIAGWYWEDTLIARCIINSSCNGIRLIGPANNLIIHDCLFFGPGRYEHRTSGERMRRNMLAGLCLQPGAWDRTEGAMDGVRVSNVTMHNVTTPLHISLKPGNTAGRISIDRLTATGVYRAAASIESWAETPIESLTLRDVSLEFTGGGTPEQARMHVRAPGVDARPLPAWGLYARNVNTLSLENVRLGLEQADARPAVMADDVRTLKLDAFRFPPQEQSASLSLNTVRAVELRDTPIELIPFKCTDLQVTATPFVVTATIDSADRPGLARVDLILPGQTATRWVWLDAQAKQSIVFADLKPPPPGQHELRCGEATREWTAE